MIKPVEGIGDKKVMAGSASEQRWSMSRVPIYMVEVEEICPFSNYCILGYHSQDTELMFQMLPKEMVLVRSPLQVSQISTTARYASSADQRTILGQTRCHLCAFP